MLIIIYLLKSKTILSCVGMPSQEAGACGVQVAVPPLSGHAPHPIEAPGAYRMAPAPHPCVLLSLRLVWVSVQALQPPRALGPWEPPVPGLRGRASPGPVLLAGGGRCVGVCGLFGATRRGCLRVLSAAT